MERSTIDDLLEAVTIEFPRPLSREEMLGLLDFVAMNLPGRMSGGFHQHYNILAPKEREYREGRGVGVDYGTLNLNGTITDFSKENFGSFDAFETYYTREDTSKIAGLRFQIIPGYSLEEHPEHSRNLWPKVKNLVGRYFSDTSPDRRHCYRV